MPDPASHPPSDPRPVLGRGVVWRSSRRRSPRREIVVASIAGAVLLAGGLYLWRRPHTPLVGTAADTPPGSVAGVAADAGYVAAVEDAGHASPVTVSDARVVECHDRGPKKTPPELCDHPSAFEKALASAVEQSASCASQSSNGAGAGGTIEYVADVSFLRQKVSVVLPRAGRSVRDARVLRACASAVRGALHGVALAGDHQHARYRISVTATYPSAESRASARAPTR